MKVRSDFKTNRIAGCVTVVVCRNRERQSRVVIVGPESEVARTSSVMSAERWRRAVVPQSAGQDLVLYDQVASPRVSIVARRDAAGLLQLKANNVGVLIRFTADRCRSEVKSHTRLSVTSP